MMTWQEKDFHIVEILSVAVIGGVYSYPRDIHHSDRSFRKADQFDGERVYRLVEHLTGRKIILSEEAGKIDEEAFESCLEDASKALFEQLEWLNHFRHSADELMQAFCTPDFLNVLSHISQVSNGVWFSVKPDRLLKHLNEYNGPSYMGGVFKSFGLN